MSNNSNDCNKNPEKKDEKIIPDTKPLESGQQILKD
jgi:hypothetical protein